MQNGLIILDRDGILNELLIREDGSTDSPMSIDEVEIFPWVPEQIKILNKELKYEFVIATNQPASAKGKISKECLIDIHLHIKNKVSYSYILNSFICFHKAEDNCDCRKPKTGLIDKAFIWHQNFQRKLSWMVGDRATDIIAGHNAGLNTALLGPSVENDLDILKEMNIKPTYHGKDLRDFVLELKRLNSLIYS